MQFFPLTRETYPLWLSFWEKTPFRTADTTFINLVGWAPVYGLEAAVEGDLFWIRRTQNGETSFWTPLGDTQKADWDRVFSSFPAGTCFERIPLPLAEKLMSTFTSEKPSQVLPVANFIRNALTSMPSNACTVSITAP